MDNQRGERMTAPLSFDLITTEGAARRGTLHTAHGTAETPAFMATATAATIKALRPEDARAAGAEIAICNTYHLMLRPGGPRLEALGGLHRFMNWPGPIVTDSGGFQVMSLAKLRDLTEDGVTFRSHLDGSLHHLTPESAANLQRMFDSDIAMCLDECTPYPSSWEKTADSMRRSMRWAERARRAFTPRPGYGQFGIVQGGIDPELRRESAEKLLGIGFEGYGIGGLAVGEGQAAMFEVLDSTVPLLPINRPRYLMGVGRPSDIVGAVVRGVDLFDCVMPTRSGRTGQAFIPQGTLNIRNAVHAEDPAPLDEACTCPTCTSASRAYVHHLFRCNEILGPMLLTAHNTHFYQTLMRDLRAALDEKRLGAFVAAFHERQTTA